MAEPSFELIFPTSSSVLGFFHHVPRQGHSLTVVFHLPTSAPCWQVYCAAVIVMSPSINMGPRFFCLPVWTEDQWLSMISP